MAMILSWLCLLLIIPRAWAGDDVILLPLETEVPSTASPVLSRDFVSLSVEFAFWPDFAGTKSNPNDLTAALLTNLRGFTHADPIMRIGGITQDHTIFVSSQREAIINNWNYQYSRDRPQNQTIGPAFWDYFGGQKHLRYIFGLNLCSNGLDAITSIQNEVNQSLSQIPPPAFHSFELGNEPDAYPIESLRPTDWNQTNYVDEWVYKTRQLHLPDGIRLFAPSYSFFETNSPTFFSPFTLWNSTYNYDRDQLVGEVSQHGYISSTGDPSNTLQGTLMNHSAIIQYVRPFAELNAFHRENGRRFTIGETNSISGQGAGGISDVFGAALWTVDYALYVASQNISRMHFHQGTSYRYGAWQPIDANGTSKGVRPPYYGLAFVSKFLGPSGTTQISNIDLGSSYTSAYAAYESGKLSRLALVNLLEYNLTSHQPGRPRKTFEFNAPLDCSHLKIETLTAPDSGSNSSITLAGISYSYGGSQGRGVEVSKPAYIVKAYSGKFEVSVGASEAYILTFME